MESSVMQSLIKSLKKFEKGFCTFQDMYHYYTCPELGLGKAALRRQPCNCAACDATIRKPWVKEIKEPEKQPRFVNPEDCFWKDVFGKHNDWHVVEVKPKGANEKEIEEDVAEVKHHVVHHAKAAIAGKCGERKIGAVSSPKCDQAPFGHFLVEFINEPGPDDETCETCQLNVVPEAKKWWTKSETVHTVNLNNLVDTDVKVEPHSENNKPAPSIERQLTNLVAVKITKESHNLALDGVWMKDQLDCNPNLVVVNGEVEEEN